MTDQTARARAEALFQRGEQQKGDAPTALAKYRASQQAARERMRKLRAVRLAREARRDRVARGPDKTPARG